MHARLATLLLLLLVIGCSPKTDERYQDMLANQQAETLAAWILLTELREERITNAVELLEMRIDSSVLFLNGSPSNVKASVPEREMSLNILQSIKAYRETHPRRQEAIIPDAESYADFSENMRQRVSNILSELKEPPTNQSTRTTDLHTP